MPEPECPHTPGLPPRSCGECLFEGNFSAAPTPVKRARPFRARYEGECAYCSTGIDKGELIIAVPNGHAHYRHVAGGARP